VASPLKSTSRSRGRVAIDSGALIDVLPFDRTTSPDDTRGFDPYALLGIINQDQKYMAMPMAC
jgi:hypothetical protein